MTKQEVLKKNKERVINDFFVDDKEGVSENKLPQQVEAMPTGLVKNKTNDLKAIEGFELQGDKTLAFANYLIDRKLVPATFHSPDQVFMAVQTAFALGFKKYGEINLAIGQMYILPSQGKVMLYGDLPLALVKRSGVLTHFEEFFIDHDHKKISMENKNLEAVPLAAMCFVGRGGKDKVEYQVTINDLQSSGIELRNKTPLSFSSSTRNPCWTKYPKIMWTRRCRHKALRTMFPDVLLGASLSAEDNPSDTKLIVEKEKVIDLKRQINAEKEPVHAERPSN